MSPCFSFAASYSEHIHLLSLPGLFLLVFLYDKSVVIESVYGSDLSEFYIKYWYNGLLIMAVINISRTDKNSVKSKE